MGFLDFLKGKPKDTGPDELTRKVEGMFENTANVESSPKRRKRDAITLETIKEQAERTQPTQAQRDGVTLETVKAETIGPMSDSELSQLRDVTPLGTKFERLFAAPPDVKRRKGSAVRETTSEDVENMFYSPPTDELNAPEPRRDMERNAGEKDPFSMSGGRFEGIGSSDYNDLLARAAAEEEAEKNVEANAEEAVRKARQSQRGSELSVAPGSQVPTTIPKLQVPSVVDDDLNKSERKELDKLRKKMGTPKTIEDMTAELTSARTMKEQLEKANKSLDEERAPKGLARINPLGGAVLASNWLSKTKLEFDAAKLGGIPKGKFVEKDGKIVWEEPQIKTWVKNAKGKWVEQSLEATPTNIRNAIITMKMKESELERAKEGTSLLRSQVRGSEGINAVREYRLNRSAQAMQTYLPARSETWTVRQGYQPRFNVPGAGTRYVRDRFLIGGSQSLQNALESHRSGLREMKARVLSNYSAPITLNPRLTGLMPGMGGTVAKLSPVGELGSSEVMSKLNVSGGGGDGVSKLSVFSGGAPKLGMGASGVSFGRMRSLGSRVGGFGKR